MRGGRQEINHKAAKTQCNAFSNRFLEARQFSADLVVARHQQPRFVVARFVGRQVRGDICLQIRHGHLGARHRCALRVQHPAGNRAARFLGRQRQQKQEAGQKTTHCAFIGPHIHLLLCQFWAFDFGPWTIHSQGIMVSGKSRPSRIALPPEAGAILAPRWKNENCFPGDKRLGTRAPEEPTLGP